MHIFHVACPVLSSILCSRALQLTHGKHAAVSPQGHDNMAQLHPRAVPIPKYLATARVWQHPSPVDINKHVAFFQYDSVASLTL